MAVAELSRVQVVTLRRATMGDARRLLDWRNDPETRANSIDTAPVSWENHCAWLERSLVHPDRQLLIAEINDTSVGTVRIDRDPVPELSWTVAPEFRGRGIGKAMVEAACPSEMSYARIKSSNKASQRIAEHAGFKLIEDGELQLWKR